jgi:hypothetical protein
LALSGGFSNSGGGEYNIVSSTPSPDGKNVAVIYAGMGGGAAGWTFLRATIVPASEQLNPEQHQDYVFDIKGGGNIEPQWADNEHLLITYTVRANSYLRVSRQNYSRNTGVNIRYVEKAE